MRRRARVGDSYIHTVWCVEKLFAFPALWCEVGDIIHNRHKYTIPSILAAISRFLSRASDISGEQESFGRHRNVFGHFHCMRMARVN